MDYIIRDECGREYRRSMFMGFKRTHVSGYYGSSLYGLLKPEYGKRYIKIMSKNNPNRNKILQELRTRKAYYVR